MRFASCVAGYFHVSVSILANIDRVQTSFLQAVGLSSEEACVFSRLAPLRMRRGIAVLAFLHCVVLGLASNLFPKLFLMMALNNIASDQIAAHVEGLARRHNKQLADIVTSRSSEQFRAAFLGRANVTVPYHSILWMNQQ